MLWIHDPLWDLIKKNAKSVFGFENPDLDFSKNRHPKSQRHAKKQLGIVFFNVLIILFKFAIQHSNQSVTLQIGILNGDNVSTH